MVGSAFATRRAEHGSFGLPPRLCFNVAVFQVKCSGCGLGTRTSFSSWGDQDCRPSCSATYKFVSQHLGHRAVMWPNVRRELRIVQGLLFLVEYDLSAPPTVHLGDSSTYGFALMDTSAQDREILRELSVRERWLLAGQDEW